MQRMCELGLRVSVRDFEREVWQRSLDNSAFPSSAFVDEPGKSTMSMGGASLSL